MDLSTLNGKQREAVLKTDGPLLILAGAGSGKTRVLTHRIAYLIEEKGVYESNILAITFTNKAAKEMRERISKLIGNVASNMWISTFHSACVRILRREIDKIGYTKDFVIYDTSDQKTVIKECLKELNIDEKRNPPKYFVGAISSAKDKLLTPEKYSMTNYTEHNQKVVCDVYELYQKKLESNNALDFNDLLMKTVELFQSDKLVLSYYQNRFKYILVDEYQDTNKAQYMLVNMLSKAHRNLCVVGDDDQSIYKFRGADLRNILDFEKDYPDAHIIRLEQNYRSSKRILEAANQVIKNNRGRKSKTLWTDNNEGELIKYYKAQNEKDEARYVIREIEKAVKYDKRKTSDFAILYRTNAQSRVLEEALMREKFSYRIYGGLKFYDRKEIKDIIAYLRIIQNPLDDVSLLRVINTPKRGIGKKTIEKLQDVARAEDKKLFSVLLELDNLSLSKKVHTNLTAFVDIIKRYLLGKDTEYNVLEIINGILHDTGYLEELKLENSIEARSRIENLNEFKTAAEEILMDDEVNALDEFLSNISLSSDLDNEETEESITLMTLHSAKGLEFPVVFMVGLEDGIFPSSMSIQEDDEVEEERRLCYVGITRAEEELHITHAALRFQFGKTSVNPASRFLQHIPDELIDVQGIVDNMSTIASDTSSFKAIANNHMISMTEKKPKPKPVNSVSSGKIGPGTRVKHKKFGEGMVISANGTGDSTQLTIAFDSQGIKKLVLGFAPIEII